MAGFITGLVFLSLEPYKNDPEVKFHAWQSIFLSIAWFGVMIVFWILVWVFISIGLWGLIWLIRLPIYLGGVALWIFLMVKAYNGGPRFKLPIIGDLAEQQASK